MRRTWFVVQAHDENLDLRPLSAHQELLDALKEAHWSVSVEREQEGPGYASVWGVYAKDAQEAITRDPYVRVWSSSEDHELKLP